MAYTNPNANRLSLSAGRNARTAQMFARKGSQEMDRAFDTEDADESAAAFQSAIDNLQSAQSLLPSPALEHDMGLAEYCLSKRVDDQEQALVHLKKSAQHLRSSLEKTKVDRSTQDLLARVLFALSELAEEQEKLDLLDEAISTMQPVVDELVDSEQVDAEYLASVCHRYGLYNVNRGLASTGQQRYQFFTPAVDFFRLAYKNDRANMHFWYCYGNALMDKGKSTPDVDERRTLFDESLTFHREAIQIIRDDPDQYGVDGPGCWIAAEFTYNFACILCLEGCHDESIQALAEAINLYGYNREFARKDTDFASIANRREFIALTTQ